MGHRLFSVLGEGLDETGISSRKLLEDRHLLKPGIGYGTAYTVDLLPVDEIVLTADNTARYYVYPTTVTGTHSGVNTLVRYETMSDLLSSSPDRFVVATSISAGDSVVWDSSVIETYETLASDGRLVIKVGPSVNFYNRTSRRHLDKSGMSRVVLTGTDQNDIEFVESVYIPDDGTYWTRNIFKSLTNVVYEGFDGAVKVLAYPLTADIDYVEDSLRALVGAGNEGPLRYVISNRTYSGSPYAHVVYQTPDLKLGRLYRKTGITAIDNDLDEAELLLVDGAGNSFVTVAQYANPYNGKLYVINSAGFLLVYEPALPGFGPCTVGLETKESYIELHPENHYSPLGVSQKLWTYHARLRHAIAGVTIKRRTPAGVESFLQADKTSWGATYTFVGPDSPVPEVSWNDFNFDVTYDEAGQWEYAITTTNKNGDTTYVTAIQVAALSPESEVDLGATSCTAVHVDHNNRLAVLNGSTFTTYDQFIDGYIADSVNQRLIAVTPYTQMEVTY
jgi:hypothetical protein